MPSGPRYVAQPWLKSPLRTPAGEIQLAGLLRNVQGIDPATMRVLRHFTLVLMVQGRGYYRDEQGLGEELGPGDVVVVFPGMAHAYGPLEGGEWTQIYFVFDGPQFALWRDKGLLNPRRPIWRLGLPDYWHQRLREVVKGEPLHGVAAPLRAVGRFLQVLSEMIATDTEHARQKGGDVWLEESLRLLGEPSAAGWLSPQVVARQVGLNYENFRKRFVQLAGESPGRYQRRRRIDLACAAIYHGELSLKHIADELGFCDVFHFSKAFTQTMRMRPSEYRRRVHGRTPEAAGG